MRGNEITMIFQEPMTSLNPLHTIEQQIGEILALHQGMGERPARERTLELLERGRHPRAGKAARRLSAPALRRPAPARDDRHGARQRAGTADRRRADDGARRHRAGADPRAARRAEGQEGHVDAVHHPRPRHRAQDRRPRLRHDQGQDRRDRADRGDLRQPAARLYAPSARRRAEGQAAGGRRDAPRR